MSDPEIPQKAPYIAKLDAGDYYWCSCGKSSKQPFCDGSHQGLDFSPIKFSLEKNQVVSLCGCKHAKKPPFCDGSHNQI
ncbi:MAG: CDGSH iron-sulfur domain-containing protein [Gammaproteobacteria bacterium]|nr:CDGSH iron-sulfur domain-containing protein [Gammaproteobacteria bacterium]